ncbi:MAG: hypothetical protein GTO63_34540 [Anaerolineae bacterium]|nr:hypothetical protein [Anaerolineae bacterium]NIN99773.1 hypothetical protein [Anaerolineae bacterium]NIQ82595.1 hypothetical protein [Anaerolineae bacterium]
MMRQFIHYFWGTIRRPGPTLEALAAQGTVRWALIAASLGTLQVWGNMALHALFGLDWLGTRPDLAEPTFVGGFGYVRVGLANWVPIFAALMPLFFVLNLVIMPGIAQLMSKLWHGKGTYEQMVNTIAFAAAVPSVVIGAASEWLFGVPIDLLSGHGYWWTAAMHGEFGPAVAAIWNFYVIGVYSALQYGWIIALGAIAIRRIQRIPVWAAILTSLVGFAVHMLIASVFVR